MAIDKQKLIALLEVFVQTSELFRREQMLYQMLFAAACKTNGLDEEKTRQAVERGRSALKEKIKEASQKDFRDLLAKLPQIVDMLEAHQDEALRILREWKPTGLPN